MALTPEPERLVPRHTSTPDLGPALITARRTTHGSFNTNAAISQAIKERLRADGQWASLTRVQQEALDMICLKLSRIVSGRADEKDHWADIIGYAQLALNEIETGVAS